MSRSATHSSRESSWSGRCRSRCAGRRLRRQARVHDSRRCSGPGGRLGSVLDICLAPVSAPELRVFTFPAFLAGGAWLLVLWTTSRFEHKFRIRTARFYLPALTFWPAVSLGVLVLLNDVWLAHRLPVFCWGFLPSGLWEGFLAAVLLLLPVSWVFSVLLYPPVFHPSASRRFADLVAQHVAWLPRKRLSVLAGELVRSVPSLVSCAAASSGNLPPPPSCRDAQAVLSALGNTRFAEEVVAKAPDFLCSLFSCMSHQRVYPPAASALARNVIQVALRDPDSFLHRETTPYDAGLLGQERPVTQSILGSPALLEAFPGLLDPPPFTGDPLPETQCEAYLRALEFAVASSSRDALPACPGPVSGAISQLHDVVIPHGCFSHPSTSASFSFRHGMRLYFFISFLREVLRILDRLSFRPPRVVRHENGWIRRETFLDVLAYAFWEAVFAAGAFRGSRSESWSLQYGAVWSELFPFGEPDGPASRAVRLRVLRIIYGHIKDLEAHPNYRGAAALRFCLNVLGWTKTRDSERSVSLFHTAVLRWTSKHWRALNRRSPRVSRACLPVGTTYDSSRRVLSRKYFTHFMERRSRPVTLPLA